MKKIQKLLELPPEEYYLAHFQILSVCLPYKLTNTEARTLAVFLSLPEKVIGDYMFNPRARKAAMKILGISSAGLTNYIKILQSKGFIIKNNENGEYKVREEVLPEKGEQNYRFRLINATHGKEQ